MHLKSFLHWEFQLKVLAASNCPLVFGTRKESKIVHKGNPKAKRGYYEMTIYNLSKGSNL